MSFLQECENFFLEYSKRKREKRTIKLIRDHIGYIAELSIYTWRTCRHRPICNVMKQDQYDSYRSIRLQSVEIAEMKATAECFEAEFVMPATKR